MICTIDAMNLLLLINQCCFFASFLLFERREAVL